MKKKLLGLLLVASLALSPSLSSADQLVDIAQKAGYKEATETYRPKSSLLIDANTGDILWQDNTDEIRDPASMSKAMSLYLVLMLYQEVKLRKILLLQPSQLMKLSLISMKFQIIRLLQVLNTRFRNLSL